LRSKASTRVRRSPLHVSCNWLTTATCPSSSRNPDSFFTLEHQRWRCSHACGIPLLSELANRYRGNRSEISYSEDESWCRCLLPSSFNATLDSNVLIKVSVVLVIGAIFLNEMRRIPIIISSILLLPSVSTVVAHISF
jgi:hypothetical protein